MADRFFRSAHSGEHPSITSRRTFEDSRLTLDTQQSISVKLLEHAAWQKRSDGIVRNNQSSRRAQLARQQDSERLQERREALRQLLAREEAEQRSEMLARMETAEQRKARVLDEALRLKAERERRREAAATEGYTAQWKERCDDLRTIDSHFFARHCAEVVEQQIDDSHTREAQRREEERQYARQWESSRQDAIRREDDKQRRRKEAVLDNRAALREQMEAHREMERHRKEQNEKEKEIHVSRIQLHAAVCRAQVTYDAIELFSSRTSLCRVCALLSSLLFSSLLSAQQHILAMDAAEAKEKAVLDNERKRRQNVREQPTH